MKKSIVLLLMLFSLTWLAAQTTGKIKGVVKDGDDPLPGAYVTIEGTTMGAQTDENGYYYIIGVRAGTYNLKCKFVGYKEGEKKGVSVKVGLTATVDFKMVSSDVVLNEITIQDIKTTGGIEKSKTTSERTMNMDDLSQQAVADVSDALSKTGGIKKDASGELHFRGGRAGEVNYVIDGASLSDPTGGSSSGGTAVNFANVESFNIQKGVPEADVGNALSGSVNIVMKIGDQQKTSGYAKYATDAFMGDNKFDYHGGEFSINGPIPFTEGMKFRPTYFLSTDMSTQNGFSASYKDPDGNYHDFGDGDITGFGFDMPIKRDNNFNFTFKTAYDLTEKIKMSATFQKSREVRYGYLGLLKYSPESANKNVEDVYSGSLNYKQTINQDSYFDLIFSVYNRKFESLPMGKTPYEFISSDVLDNGEIFDVNRNGIRDGGNCEGYADANFNGCFDREFFIDLNGNGNYDEVEPFADQDFNGVWTGDYLFNVNNNKDAAGNALWDFYENGQSYNGFTSGTYKLTNGQTVVVAGSILKGAIVEGYLDNNFDGKFNANIYLTVDNDNNIVDTAEPYFDGDFYYDTGEPFVDVPRFTETETGGWVCVIDGEQNSKPYKLDKMTKAAFHQYFPNSDISEFLFEIPTQNGIVKVECDSISTPTHYILSYPAEPYYELPSTYASVTQTRLRYNMACDYPNGKMDEFEAYMTRKSYNATPYKQLGYKDLGNGMVRWEGSYVVYYGPSTEILLSENKNLALISPDPARNSTWIDRNGNLKYDAPNQHYDNGEEFVDYNHNGNWNDKDLFANPGTINRPTYDYRNNYVYSFKGNYTNQLDKFNMLTAGFDLKMNNLEYLSIRGVQEKTDNSTTFPGAYNLRGDTRTYYDYKPIELAMYVKNKMEFEDLVLNPGLRLDLRYLDDDIKKDYETKKAQKVPGYEETFKQTIASLSPRFGISHSISETSKLFFSYGHLYQLPNYTVIFDPNDGGGVNSVYGNMNLSYQKNVQYELGVVNEMGDYMLDITGYFKDIYDMLNTKKYKDRFGDEYNVYVNSDYGKSRGVEITLDKALSNHYSWSVNYTLGYAYGKSSSATDNAAQADPRDVKIREFPLDWDERHSLNTSVSLVYGENELLFDTPYLDNWSISLSTDFGSGKPFTPTVQYYENKGQVKLEKDIERNSERMPWTSNSDLRLSKSFVFSSGSGEQKISYGKIKLDFDIYNLFDKVNVNDVYANSGSWYNPGEVGGYDILSEKPEQAEFYKDFSKISERRNYRFSVSYNW